MKRIAATVGLVERPEVTCRRGDAAHGLPASDDLLQPGTASPLTEALQAARRNSVRGTCPARDRRPRGRRAYGDVGARHHPTTGGHIQLRPRAVLAPTGTLWCSAGTKGRGLQPCSGPHPRLPVRPGPSKRQTFPYLRHDTSALLEAVALARGCVPDAGTATRTFWSSSSSSPPPILGGSCRWWSTNLAAHEQPTVRAWRARHPGAAALHSDLGLIAAPDRGVLLDHHASGPASRSPLPWTTMTR
jgi:hypothetical protein